MAKKNRDEDRGRSTLWVLGKEGERLRFLRGVVTHHLMQKGFDFDDAYAIARALRDRLSSRGEVTKSEIRDTLEELVESTFGTEALERLHHRPRAKSRLIVRTGGIRQPFSRGLLATSMHAAGLDFDRAYGLVTDLEAELRRDQVEDLTSDDLARRAGDILEREESRAAAERYRSVRQLRRLPKPLVVYVGGASGTGKSTVALALAPLLRIYRVTATDTIRQVMRSLISPQILPAIHGSSFDFPSLLDADEEDQDPEQALIAAFLEQATRIGVGVRAVVERAVAENASAVVEGVHLAPPIVPFGDLDGACYQVPLVLGISDVEEHRSRFLTRASRQASRYVERFTAIRQLHDFVLERAENEGIPFLDTSLDQATPRALRLVVTMLQEQWPTLAEGRSEADRPPTLLLAIDGLADVPNRALGGRTPLQAAETPTFDRLAREGACGLADPVEPGIVPDTAAGTLALLGQAPTAAKRGPVEAAGADFRLRAGDVALRANLATFDGQQIIDRRAGRIRSGAPKLAKALDRLSWPGKDKGLEVRVAAGTEHRLAIILRGPDLSSAIRGSDPGEGAVPGLALEPQATDPNDPEAIQTARWLAEFEAAARDVLEDHDINHQRREKGLPPANAILSRGAGRHHRLAPIEIHDRPLRIACVAGDRTVRGIASWLEAEIFNKPAMTANLDTDLGLKFELALAALRDHELVMLHAKGADIAAHDRLPEKKAAFLEKIDRQLARLLEDVEGPLRVVIGSDHATSSESGHHTADPVPVLIWGPGVEPDDAEAFDEGHVASGRLGRFPLQMLLGRVLDLG